MSASQEEQETPSRSPPRNKSSKISTACVACRKRKSRCSGRPLPCKGCQIRGTDCILNEQNDGRRHANSSRNAHTLDIYRQLFATLVYAFESDEESPSSCWFRFPRSGASLDQVATVLWTELRRNANLNRWGTYDVGKLKEMLNRLWETQQEKPKQELLSANVIADTASSPKTTSSILKLADDQRGTRRGWHPSLQLHSSRKVNEGSSHSRKSGPKGIHCCLLRPQAIESLTRDTMASRSRPVGASFVECFRGGRETSLGGGQNHHPVFSSEVSRGQNLAPGLPHTILPITIYEDSPLSRVYTDFRDAARQLIMNGSSASEFLYDGGAIDVSLLFRERTGTDDLGLANWASEVCRSFVDLDIYVRLAYIVFHTHLMRWMIMPTERHYSMIPTMVKPTGTQLYIGHHIAVDFLPFHILRDHLVDQFQDFVTPLAAADLSCNWPFDLAGALDQNPALNSITCSPAFQDHVIDQNNWTINRSILKTFPRLENQLMVKRQ